MNVTCFKRLIPCLFNIGKIRFSPEDVDGLKQWMDAYEGVTESGGFVSAWADQSGNGNNAAQASGGAQPSYSATGFNSKPTLVFVDNIWLDIASDLTASSSTIFVVYKLDDSADRFTNLLSYSGNLELWANSNKTVPTYEGVPVFFGPNALTASQHFLGTDGQNTNPHLIQVSWNGGDVNSAASYSGNFDRIAQTIESGGVFGNTTTSAIGRRLPGGSAGFIGRISEIILYDGVVGSTDASKIRSYLARKWSL